MVEAILDFLRVTVGPTFAVVCVFEGTRRLRSLGAHRNGVISLVLGLAFFASYAAFGYYAHHLQVKVLELEKPIAVPELPETWGDTFTRQVRIRNSLEIAKVAFMESGHLQKHYVEPGQWVLYAPSQEEITKREDMIQQLAEVRYYEQATEWLPERWALTALISALFGVAFGRKVS